MKKSGYVIFIITALVLGFLTGLFIGRNYVKGDILVMFEGDEDVGVININAATIDELKLIPGFGEITCQKIVDYRIRKGPFQSIYDLKNITGITDEKIEQIQQMITVD